MSAQKPPTGQNHHRSRRKPVERGINKPPEELKSPPPSISQDLRRNADLIKRKVAQKQVNNGTAKQHRQVLQELLTAIKIEAEQNIASRETPAGNKYKRHAPLPPFKGAFIGATSSTPDLASAPPSPKEAPRRGKLRKSLSMSGSRMLFHSFLNTIRITSKRRSRSQDSIFDLGYLDHDQQVVRNAAVKAQQRRGSVQQMPHTRSLSAEPRSQQSVVERDPTPNRGSPTTAKRPDKLFLSSPLSAKKRFRERSPLVKTPIFIPEKAFDQTDGPRKITFKGVVRLRAKNEIDLFEKLISHHIQNNMQTTNL